MDFVELEAVEGLRWSWNSWPAAPSSKSELIIPLSIMCTPLMQGPEMPLLPYDPLSCTGCGAVLNPYARLDYQSRIWHCPFCSRRNPFPRSIADADTNLPAELFPTYTTVEYSSSCSSLHLLPNAGAGSVAAPAFVFVIDISTPEDELRFLKNELLLLLHRLPDNALVALVTFDSMVYLHDLQYSHCSRLVIFHGHRQLFSDQIRKFLNISRPHQLHLGQIPSIPKQGFLVSISECEFSITAAIEDIHSTSNFRPGCRPPRCTGAAVSAALGLLECCLINTGSRIMVFTSGPATVGPGLVVDTDIRQAMRTHHDIFSGRSRHHPKSCSFYQQISKRLSDASVVLDLFACSLDQVGAAELREPVEQSGGLVILADSFESDQFRKCLSHLFERNDEGYLKMNFDATIEIVTTKDVKICGALGPCVSLRKNNSLVSESEVGQGGTCVWKLNTITDRTCIAFFFQVNDEQKVQPGSAFLIQFITRYRQGNMGPRKRVTTAARRWVASDSTDIAAGFDQEAAASVMARLAILRAETCYARDVIRWLDDQLIRFSSKFGDYVPEDPSSFRLSSIFSLYPQFMFHLRRSQFIDVSNTTPDETAYFRVMLNREGVVGSLIMIQPTLFQYSFDGPPVPVLLDIRSICPDSILLFDSFFHVVIHYGSKVTHWRKVGYDKDPNHENFRKLLEAPELDAEQLVAERVPVPKFIRCDQYSSQARFLLAKLNPSVTQNSTYTEGSDIIFTDDLSLEIFLDQLQVLAVQG
ncbi:protein transport protein SEC23 G [Lotus japonicus]|uniref:protein transport protein SEC23 G n=1 Tax=Lotus japonicus TaxID=34305 RepID=UPI002584BA27|nr:protein transport protein SEC23 G [Lotus japonicus]